MSGVSFQEKVVVIVEAAVRRAEKLNQFSKNLELAGMKMTEMGQITTRYGRKALGLTQITDRLAKSMDTGKKMAKGFKMELLGTMFFGKMLQDTFFGLLRPIMETFGVFELFSAMLTVLFLPIMESLFPVILKVIEWFMNMDPATQKLVGGAVVATAAFGGLLFAASALQLGLNALHDVIGANALGKFRKFMKNLSTFTPSKGWTEMFGKKGFFKQKFRKRFKGLLKKFDRQWGKFKKSILGRTIQVAVSIYFIWEFLKSVAKMVSGADVSLKDRLSSVFNATIAGGIIGGFTGALIGLSISLLINFLDLMFDENARTQLDQELQDMTKSLSEHIETWFEKHLKIDLSKAVTTGLKIWGKSPKLMTALLGPVGGVSSWWASKMLEGPQLNDFIMRPGSAPIAFSPNDTVVGFKGASPFGNNGGGVVLNQTLNIMVSNVDLIRREIDDANRRTVDELRRIVKS